MFRHHGKSVYLAALLMLCSPWAGWADQDKPPPAKAGTEEEKPEEVAGEDTGSEGQEIEDCPQGQDDESNSNYQYIEFRLSPSGSISLAELPERGAFVQPNKSVVVRVAHDRRYAVSVSLTGTAGEFEGDLRAGRSDRGGKSGGGAAAPGDRQTCETTLFSFAPRVPGSIVLRVGARPVEAELPEVPDATLELLVEKRYTGAFRLGFAASFGLEGQGESDVQSVDYSYYRSPEGTIGAYRSNLNLELLLSFVAYPEVFSGEGGRSYTHPGVGRLAPFLALGVLRSDLNKDLSLDLLSSVYGGIDIELHPELSISAGLGLRKLKRLDGGFEIGDMIENGATIPTRPVWRPAAIIMLSVSAEALRLGASGATP